MTDVLTAEQRRRNMVAIRGKDTKPEMVVRRAAHALGYRFRLHRRDLPGAPDLVFPRFKKVVMVHGCYWHMHSCRWGAVTPKTNVEFWQAKRSGNVERDRRNLKALRRLGWTVLVIWECQTGSIGNVRRSLGKFFGAAPIITRHTSPSASPPPPRDR